MATPAAVLSILLEAKTEDAASKLRSYQGQLESANKHTETLGRTSQETGDKIERMKGHVDRTGASLSGLAKAALAAGGAFAAYEAAKSAIADTVDLAEATERLSAATGANNKTTSAFIEVAKARGLSISASATSFVTLATNIRRAEIGSKTATQAFKQLGISQDDLKGKAPIQVMGMVADGLRRIRDPAIRAAIAQQLFGRGMQSLMPILVHGGAAFNDALKAAQRFGAYLPSGANSAERLVTAQENLTLAMDGLKIQFTQAVLPALVKVSGYFFTFLKQMQSGKGIGGTFAAAIGLVWKALKSIAGTLPAIVNWIKGMVNEFKQGKPLVVALAGALGGLVATYLALYTALKLARTAQDLFRAAELSNPYVVLALAIAAVVGALILLYNKVKVVHDALSGLIGFVRNLFDEFKKGNPILVGIVAVLAGLTAGIIAFMAVTKAVEAVEVAWTAITGALSTAQETLNLVTMAWPGFFIIAAIVAVVAILAVLYLKVKVVHDAINAAWHAIETATKAVWPTVRAILVTTWDVIKAIVTNTLTFIVNLVIDQFNAIKKIIQGVLNIISGIVEVFSGIFQGNFSKMWDGVKKIFSGAIDVIVGLVLDMTAPLRAAATTAFSAIRDALVDVLNWVINKLDWFISKINDVGNVLGSVIKAVTGQSVDLKIGKIGDIATPWRNAVPTAGIQAQATRNAALLAGEQHAARRRRERPRPHEQAHARAMRQHTASLNQQTRVARRAASGVGYNAEKGIATLRLAGLTNTQKQAAIQTAVDRLDQQILALQIQRANTRSKTEKKSLEHEIQILELRKRGYELQKTELDQRISAQKKQTTAANKVAKEQLKAQKEANKHWLATQKAVPSKSPADELRKVQLANELRQAKQQGNVARETQIKGQQLGLDRKWVSEDQKKLARINRLLASPGLSAARRQALVKDKAALLHEIGSLQGNIGTLSTALSGGTGSGSTGGTSTTGFDVAPTGANTLLPTAVDVRRAMGGRMFGHHVNHNNITINVHRAEDVPKVVDELEKATRTHLHAKLRSAGLRGT